MSHRKPLPQLAKDPEVQAKLIKYAPFTPQPSENREPRPIRRLIKSRLYDDSGLPNEEIEYMREHPEDLEWLKAHVRPRIWRKFVAVANARKPPGTLDIEE